MRTPREGVGADWEGVHEEKELAVGVVAIAQNTSVPVRRGECAVIATVVDAGPDGAWYIIISVSVDYGHVDQVIGVHCLIGSNVEQRDNWLISRDHASQKYGRADCYQHRSRDYVGCTRRHHNTVTVPAR